MEFILLQAEQTSEIYGRSHFIGDCFNLMRSRSVLCIKDDQIVGDTLCLDSNNVDSTASKPITLEKCEIKDVSYCKPKWHYSEWTEVSSMESFAQ